MPKKMSQPLKELQWKSMCKVLSQGTTDFQKAALKLHQQKRLVRVFAERPVESTNFILCNDLLVEIIRLKSLYGRIFF